MLFELACLLLLLDLHTVFSQSLNVYTLAGSGLTTPTASPGFGTYATFNGPYAMVAVPDGSIYVTDYLNSRIRKITLDGQVTNYAGQSTRGSTNGAVSLALFNFPCGLTSDPSGNLYIADSTSNLIRKIDTTLNTVSTYAGSQQGFRNNNNPLNARFDSPRDVARDSNGNFYVADYNNKRIRLISTTLIVSTFAGTGIAGNTDGSTAIATLNFPVSITISSTNIIYFIDSGSSRIRKIQSSTVTTIAGSSSGFADGTESNARFSSPYEMAIDNTNSLMYIADSSNSRIRILNLANNQVTTFTGSSSGFVDGAITVARFMSPRGIAFDITSNMIVSDYGGNRLRRIVSCAMGTKWNQISKTCVSTSCPAGQDFDSSTSTCKSCQLGYYKDISGTGSCGQCGIGTESSADRTFCETCKDQTYRPSLTFDSCIPCPQNSICNDTAFQCDLGFEYISSSNSCGPCVQNKYKDVIGNSACQYCPLGTEFATSSSCTTCQTGNFRSSLTMNACTSCPIASFCTIYDFLCLAGYTINSGATDCLLCDLGSFKSSQSNDACQSCTLGTESSSDRQSCTPCDSGTFRSLSSQSSCISCPVFSACNTTAFQCLPGYEPNLEQNDCIKCNDDFVKNETGNSFCYKCPIGSQYLNETTCEPCPTGTYRSDLTQSFCINCPENSNCSSTGYSCRAGYGFNSTGKTCDQCVKNYYKSSISNSACIQCGIGTISSSDFTACDTCLPGSYRSSLAMPDCLTCPDNSQCPPTGFSCDAGYQYNASAISCDFCPLNYYKLSTGNTVCGQCSIGTVSNLNRTSCDPCQTGKYRNSLSQSSCIDCPVNSDCYSTYFTCKPGFQFNATSLECTQCLLGYAKSVSANISCSRCGVGTESNSNRTQCVSCLTNTYKPSVFLDSCISCPGNATCDPSSFSCNQGFTLNIITEKCYQCQLGYSKNILGNVTCSICPIGKQSSSDRRLCENCPTGSFRPSQTYESCIPCPTFATCTLTSFSCPLPYRNTGTACEICPIGTEVSPGGYQCTGCSVNKQRSSLSMTTCQSCPSNSYCAPSSFLCDPGYQISSDGTRCEACLPGYAKSSYNNTLCYQCPLRQEPDTLRTQCQDCAFGYFKPSLDLNNCISCTIGVSCNATDFKCLSGFTVDSPATYTCKQCEDGYYKELEGNSDCLACPSSKFSSGSFTSCVSCPLGFFKTENSTVCTKCLIGTESNDVRDGCKICSFGTYRPSLEYNKCIACPTGAICTTTELRCQEGWWINASGKGCTNVKDNDSSTNSFYGIPMNFILICSIGGGTILVFAFIIMQYRRRNLAVRDLTFEERRSLNRRLKESVLRQQEAWDNELFHETDKSVDKLSPQNQSSSFVRNSPSILRRLSFSQEAKESKRTSKYGRVDSAELLKSDTSSNRSK